MANEWTVDIRFADGTWHTKERRPSSEAAKEWAREWRRLGRREGRYTAARIFDPLGRLVFVADFSEGVGRMRWRDGSFATREALARSDD